MSDDWPAIVARGGKLAIGNWKMRGTRAMLPIVAEIAAAARACPVVGVGLAVPHTLIAAASSVAPSLAIGAQDRHAEPSGAHTGGVSAAMVRDAGAHFAILNHSERRHGANALATTVRARIARAAEQGLTIVLCCGETREERRAGIAEQAVCARLADLLAGPGPRPAIVLAYETYWAIGSGEQPSLAQIVAMHAAIRDTAHAQTGGAIIAVVYGGSGTPDGAGAIAGLPGTDGVLVGSASLHAAAFARIVQALCGEARRPT